MKSKKKIVIPVVILVILGIVAAIADSAGPGSGQQGNSRVGSTGEHFCGYPGSWWHYPADTTDRNHRAGRNCVYHAKDERRNHCHQF